MDSATKVVKNVIRSISPMKVIEKVFSRNTSHQKQKNKENEDENKAKQSIVKSNASKLDQILADESILTNNTIAEKESEQVASSLKKEQKSKRMSEQVLQQLSVNETNNILSEIEKIQENCSRIKEQKSIPTEEQEEIRKQLRNDLINQEKNNERMHSPMRQALQKGYMKMMEEEQQNDNQKVNKPKTKGKICKLCNLVMNNKQSNKMLACCHKFHTDCLAKVSKKLVECPLCNTQKQFTMKLTN